VFFFFLYCFVIDAQRYPLFFRMMLADDFFFIQCNKEVEYILIETIFYFHTDMQEELKNSIIYPHEDKH